MSEYKIPAEVLEQAAAAARNNATKDLSFDLGGWDTAPEVVREQWRTVVRIAAPLIAADTFRAGQAAAGREIERRYCSRAIADEIHEEAVSLLIEVARDYAAERSR